MRYLLALLPVWLLVSVIACERPPYQEHWEAWVQYASAIDTLPAAITSRVAIQQLQGYRLQKSIAESVYVFEYHADHQQLLRQLAYLPIPADTTRADVQYHAVTDVETRKNIEAVLTERHLAQSFHWTESLNDFTIYESVKHQRHWLLLSHSSDRVIHIIS